MDDTVSDLRAGSEKSVIVVGAGVAGMSAACALSEAGLRVRLVERRNYLGGRNLRSVAWPRIAKANKTTGAYPNG